MNTSIAHGSTMLGSLPNIKGWFSHEDLFTGTAHADGSLFVNSTGGPASYAGAVQMTRGYAKWNFNAHNASSVYTDGEQLVVPSNLFMYYVVKY